MSDPHSPRPLTEVVYPDAVRTALGLMRSAVLSGESWSVELAAAYEDAVDVLPAAEPAATADAAWEALRDDVEYAMGNDEYGQPWEAGASLFARHRPLIEAAIRSAGTPPASRETCRIIGASPHDPDQGALCLTHDRRLRDCAPPEPVGGREAREAAPLELVAVFHLAYCLGDAHHAMPPCGERADAFWRRALQASPPTGVSETLREPDYEKMRRERGWPTPNHMRRTADALDSLTPAKYGDVLRWFADLADASLPPALAREQADSEPQQPELPAHEAG